MGIAQALRDDFLDPISLELMTDPVMVSDGHTYERSGIEEWFRDHRTSPKTNAPLADLTLTPNRTLRSAIIQWKESLPPEVPAAPLPPPILDGK
eukprot:NODE_7566_length_449_cov_49.655000_g6728_i0.p2 GENE.NODE_7566_length_449_cov_49.655000_g6728_i0~~NODE_7566_length_449_cov_49.655000_g6728_i0.p2  ORF type:complete len:94 (-),score=22.04 NODE_7566_length_449_cov_49.655000_g6728_i0:70-351(-)